MAVKPILLCGNCRAALDSGDKFCPACGAAVEWDGGSTAPVSQPSSTSTVICPSCGILNLSVNSVCSGCGTSLASATTPRDEKTGAKKKSVDGRREPERKGEAGKKTESWKMLTIAGVIVVAVLIAIGVFRNPPKDLTQQEESQGASTGPSISPTLVSDIEALQKNVDANPQDSGALLKLANALHDAKFMPRAIETYKKYLSLKPSDPDARVDMGICYFESGDSPAALKEMESALKYDPKHQMAMFNLGIVTLNQGNLPLSNEWFKKAVAVNPNTQIGQRAQQILSQHSTVQQ